MEGGRIIRNENYFYSTRIARKELNTVCAVTVGVHDAFDHTAYFGNTEASVKYEQMKSELGEFIGMETAGDEEFEIYRHFADKY